MLFDSPVGGRSHEAQKHRQQYEPMAQTEYGGGEELLEKNLRGCTWRGGGGGRGCTRVERHKLQNKGT